MHGPKLVRLQVRGETASIHADSQVPPVGHSAQMSPLGSLQDNTTEIQGTQCRLVCTCPAWSEGGNHCVPGCHVAEYLCVLSGSGNHCISHRHTAESAAPYSAVRCDIGDQTPTLVLAEKSLL